MGTRYNSYMDVRPLVCFIATSLDGYIAGPAGEIDWLFTDQDLGNTSFYANVDTVVTRHLRVG